ncbi:putative reverse transcriptase domain-containing protein [Tanacetum coccineum]
MDVPPSPNHVFNFPEEEENFDEDPQEEPEEEFEEDPEEDPEEEFEADAEEDAPPAATPPMGSPITPPPLSESPSDLKAAALVDTNGTLDVPPPSSTFEVGGPPSVSSIPPFYLHGSKIKRLSDNDEVLVCGLEDKDLEKEEEMEKMKKCLETLEFNYDLVLRDKDKLERALFNVQTWVSDSCIVDRIMPLKMMKRKAVKKMVKKQIAEAIEEYEKTRVNPCNAGGYGPVITGGTVNVQDDGFRRYNKCLKFASGAEEDKVMFAASTFEGRALTWWNGNEMTSRHTTIFHELALMCPDLVPNEKKKVKRYIRGFPERIKGNITSSKPTTLHEAINMAREVVEQAVQGNAARVSESNKRKWEDHQKNNPNTNNNNRNRNNNHHQQPIKRQETARVYAAVPTKGRGYNGNLPWCHRCKAHHNQGPCPLNCGRCNKLGHQEKDCRVRIPATGGNALQDVTCFGCGRRDTTGTSVQEEETRRMKVLVAEPML